MDCHFIIIIFFCFFLLLEIFNFQIRFNSLLSNLSNLTLRCTETAGSKVPSLQLLGGDIELVLFHGLLAILCHLSSGSISYQQ